MYDFFLNTKILQFSLLTWELVPDQNLLRLSSWISEMISIFGYLKKQHFLLFLNLNIGIWIHIFIYWYYFQANPGPTHQHKLQCLNESNIFKSRGLRFIHLNINSLLPKIKEFWIIAKLTNAAIIGISESKLDESVLEPEIQIDDYKILRCDRNRHTGGVACYIRNDLSYNISVFPSEIESVFFEIFLPNFKPITVGTIYCPPNQSNFLKVLNENINKIDSISNEIYILGDFNINLSFNDSYIFSKKIC